MATLYITSNASSGDGTLRAALSSASSGDVIQPDPSVFPSGTPCVIASTGAFTFPEGVTVDGAQTRVTISGTGGSMTVRGNAVLRHIDFLQYLATTSTGFLWIQSAATFDSCSFCGNSAGRSVFFIRSSASVDCLNCYFAGNRGENEVAVIYLADETSAATLTNCTIVGNVTTTGAQWNREPMLIDCKNDDDGLVAPPPTGWSYETWTAAGWQDWNPHILTASEDARGFNCIGARYDLEGVPRVNGTLGAFETVDADLYWVGVDSNGDVVESPSMDAADGWAADRFATVGGTTAPADVASLFVGDAVTFAGTFGRYTAGLTTTLTTGGGAVSIAAQYVVDPQSTNAARVGRGGLTLTGDSTLTLLDGQDLDHLTMPTPGNFIIYADGEFELESYAIPSGVRLSIARATIGNLTLNGGYLTVTDRLDVDDLTIVNAPLYIESPALVYVRTSIAFSGGGAVVGQGARAYLSAPSNQTLQGGGFIRLYSDAAASDFVATTKKFKTSFSWNAATVTTLELTAPEYALISATASAADPPTADITGTSTFRIWGGDDWLTAATSPAPLFKFWQVAPWATALASVDESAYNVAVYGASPNIERETTEE